MSKEKTSTDLVCKLTLEEKISLLSGGDFWHTMGIKNKGIPSVMLTDGPHGLRKQDETPDHLGIAKSVPATCFPTAAATACSFDPELLSEMGEALGEECLANQVSVILGPGVNIKRNPLCGRNFEYFSEDPYLAGCLGSGIVKGLKRKNVGASIKHFLANNQENGRMVSNSVVDERALREIYLPAFEWIVKDSQPASIMGAYNKLNGEFCCESRKALTKILRDEWGFKGLVVTDWGAMNDRVAALQAGCDLEMPSSSGCNGRKLRQAVQDGELSEKVIDCSVTRVVDMVMKTAHKASSSDMTGAQQSDDCKHQYIELNHKLARKIASESAVLLKNNGMLPLKEEKGLLVIGEFAKAPRYQGAGSSQIHPVRINSFCNELDRNHVKYEYAKGYDAANGETTEELINDAVKRAQNAKKIVIMAGLPSSYESEGFDRKGISLPPSHDKLIRRVAEVNPNVCVVLSTGGVVLLPWKNQVSAILNMYLSGQNGGGAVYDLLFGICSPCGKLAETYPEDIQDVPSMPWFDKEGKTVPYCESIFVGYRYYDTVQMKVAFPFGYGLTYTTFSYDSIKVSSDDITFSEKEAEKLSCESDNLVMVEVGVTNTGSVTAKEIVELYIKAPQSRQFRPEHELKGFAKVELEPGQTKTVQIRLSGRSFAFYNIRRQQWEITDGEYEIQIGASSRDIRLRKKISVIWKRNVKQDELNTDEFEAYHLKGGMRIHVNEEDFEKLLGHRIPSDPPIRPFTVNSTLGDIKVHWFGRLLNQKMYEQAEAAYATQDKKSSETFRRMLDAMFADLPLRALGLMSGGILTPDQVDGIVMVLNGHLFKGLKKIKK